MIWQNKKKFFFAFIFLISSVIMSILSLLSISINDQTYGHLEHTPRYNGGGTSIGDYYIYQSMEPEYAKPGDPVTIHFSLQDRNGRDIQNVTTLVEIYSQKTGKQIQVYPWTERENGDFELDYSFSDIGTYNIVVSILKPNLSNTFDPDYHGSSNRSILYSNINCNCERAVFNISVSNSFGIIYSTTVLMGALISLLMLGLVLFLKFKLIRKQKAHSLTNRETLKYIIPLLAMAAGIVHIVVNPEHSSLRIEYSIFLLVAAVFQVVYGLLYLIGISSLKDSNYDQKDNSKRYLHSNNIIRINLFGLVGTLILIGLYFYTLILPPPLSPNDEPESISLAGVLVQISEIALVIGIVYLIRVEYKEKRRLVDDKLL